MLTIDQERLDCFMRGLKRRNPSQPEFAQAVYEVAVSGLEMTQNSMQMPWCLVEIDERVALRIRGRNKQ